MFAALGALHKVASLVPLGLTVRPVGVCHQYQAHGTCRFGERCRYRHVGQSAQNYSSNVVEMTAGSLSHSSTVPIRTIYDDPESQQPLAAFFSNYPEFDYNSSASPVVEFRRMCRFFRWGGSTQKADARGAFNDALALQFNAMYGSDVGDIRSWILLCFVLQIDPLPEGLQACREVVRATYVNLVDLVQIKLDDMLDVNEHGELIFTVSAQDPRNDLKKFDSEEELSKYTKTTGKIFPRENAHAGGVLRFLLRHIAHPRKQPAARPDGKEPTAKADQPDVNQKEEGRKRTPRQR